MADVSNWSDTLCERMRLGRFAEARAAIPPHLKSMDGISSPDQGLALSAFLGSIAYQGCERRLLRQLCERFPEDPRVEAAWAVERIGLGHYLEVVRWLNRSASGSQWVGRALSDRELAHAFLHLKWRDFENALLKIEAAAEAGADRERIQLMRIGLEIERRDFQAALDVAEPSAEEFPDSLKVNRNLAWILFQLDRTEEALSRFAKLTSSSDYLPLWLGYGSALADCGHLDQALEVSEQALDLAPTFGPQLQRAASFFAMYMAAQSGDPKRSQAQRERWMSRERAIWRELQPSNKPPIVLKLPFQVQDFVSCAPASTAAILGFFEEHIDHQEIAKQITYRGTWDTDLVDWLEEAGFVVRPFQLEEGTAQELIDRDLPFSLEMRNSESGHRTTVIGYHEAVGNLVLLDPGNRHHVEHSLKHQLATQEARGLICLLILPASRAAELVDLALPEEGRCRIALENERAATQFDLIRLDQLKEEFQNWPEDALKWECELTQAWARSDSKGRMEAARKASEAYPDDSYCAGRFAESLFQAAQWEALDDLLEHWTKRPSCPPSLIKMWGQRLRRKPSGHKPAWNAFEKVAKRSSVSQVPFGEMAELLNADPETRTEALSFARMHACLHPHDEASAMRYADFCSKAGRREEAEQFLQARAIRNRDASADPVTTYARWLIEERRNEDAIALLRDAPRKDRSAQTRLVESLFGLYADLHRLDEAAALLDQEAQGILPRVLLYLRSNLALLRGDREQSLSLMEELVLSDEATTLEWDQYFSQLSSFRGEKWVSLEIRRKLENDQVTETFLFPAWNFCMDLDDFMLAHEVVDRFYKASGDTILARKLWSRTLRAQGRHDEAMEAANAVLQADPFAHEAWLDLAQCQLMLGDPGSCRESLRRTFALSGPTARTLNLFLESADEFEERRRLIEEIQELMLESEPDPGCFQQVVSEAFHILPPDQVTPWISTIRSRYPFRTNLDDALAAALAGSHRAQEAEQVAREAREQNPTDPGLVLRVAHCIYLQDRKQDAVDFLMANRSEFVDSASLARLQAVAHQSLDQHAEAAEVLRQAIPRFPSEPELIQHLARIEWSLNQRAAAVENIADYCSKAPMDFAAWSYWIRWLSSLKRDEETIEVAQRLVALAPHEPRSYSVLASAYKLNQRNEEELEARKQAIALDPESVSQHSSLASALTRQGRFSDAREVLQQATKKLGRGIQLLTREAELVRAQGSLDEARGLLHAALQEHPGASHAWSQYWGWLNQDKAVDDLARLATSPPESLRENPRLQLHAAERLHEQGRDQEAVRFYQAAFSLDQEDEYLMKELLRAYRYVDDWDGVRTVLDRDLNASSLHQATLQEVVACAGYAKHKRLHNFVHEAIHRSDIGAWVWFALSYGLEQQSVRNKVAQSAIQLAEQSDKTHVNANVAKLLAELCFEDAPKWRAASRLNRFLKRLQGRFCDHEEYLSVLQSIADGSRAPCQRQLKRWIKSQIQSPVHHAELWGAVGYMLGTHDPKWVYKTLHPTVDAIEAKDWMLWHYASACISIGELEEAEKQVQRALADPSPRVREEIRSLQAELRLLRSDPEWVRANSRELAAFTNFRDRIRDHTVECLAKAMLASKRSHKKKIYRDWLRHTSSHVVTRTPGTPINVAQDLKPAMWAKVLRDPRPLLIHLGTRYLSLRSSDNDA